MVVAVLAAVIVFLLLERAWHARGETAERRLLVNALIAKDGRELAVLERAEQRPPKAKDNGGTPRPQLLPEGL